MAVADAMHSSVNFDHRKMRGPFLTSLLLQMCHCEFLPLYGAHSELYRVDRTGHDIYSHRNEVREDSKKEARLINMKLAGRLDTSLIRLNTSASSGWFEIILRWRVGEEENYNPANSVIPCLDEC